MLVFGFQLKAIKTGNCGKQNGVQGSHLRAAISSRV
jgi:hypothetical protein